VKITRVDLENVKSYERESVHFTRGTNAICGYNGAGKSTILEAIGFVLFDALLTTQDQFVREGEKTASVTVHVVGEDGRPFQVVRKCGSYSQYYVYDPEIDQKLTEGKADTMGWLRQFAGVGRSGDLATLFEDAVGVPQGLLTAAFLETAGRRKDVFNPLLRVDEYEEVWRGLREPASALRDDIAEAERRIAGLEGEIKALPAEEEKAANLRIAIAEDETAQKEARAELDAVVGQKQEMEAVKQRLEELERAVAEARGDVRTVEARWEDAREAVEKAEAARNVVVETEEGYEAFRAAEEALATLEERRKARDRLMEERQGGDKALALARQEVERLEDELEAVAEAEETMARLAPEVEEQERLEEALAEAKREADRLADRRRAVEEKREQVSRLEAELVEVEKGLEALAEVEAATEKQKRTLRKTEEARDALKSEVAAAEASLDQVRKQTETLARAEEATCPVCEGPLTAEHRAELLERNRAQEAELGRALDGLRRQQRELEGRRQTLQAELEEHQSRLKGLPRRAEAEKLADQIAEEREALDELAEAVAALADAPTKVEELTGKLEALGDPRRAHVRAADMADRREAVEEALAEAEGEMTELAAQVSALEQELAAYEDVEARIDAERETRERYAENHERYVAHVREAEALEARRKEVAAQEEALTAARAERDQLVAERDAVAEAYDAEAYAEVTERTDRLRSTVATLEEGLRRQQEQLEEVEATIEYLTGVEAALEEARGERDELEALLSLLETLRQAVRDAGPKVTQALVEVISVQAARLYADIMADHSARLRWTEDYEILLTSDGRERGFRQLSGGEQMAAALAVRLALLKEVSAVDLAFFDEPTANLDDRRRDNLAEQILNVKGFSQLFVISHDDTFEQDTDHVVRVVKEDGRSQAIGE
jgi:exonuclease SbcC